MGITVDVFSDLAATDGANVAAPTKAAPCRTRRRPIMGKLDFGTTRPPLNRILTCAPGYPSSITQWSPNPLKCQTLSLCTSSMCALEASDVEFEGSQGSC